LTPLLPRTLPRLSSRAKRGICFGFLELRLAEFHNRTQTEVVAGVRQVKRQAGLFIEGHITRFGLNFRRLIYWKICLDNMICLTYYG
jgi:hypothetical protein